MTHYSQARRTHQETTCQAGLLIDGGECGRARLHENEGRIGGFPGLGNDLYLCREHIHLHLTYSDRKRINGDLLEELLDRCQETARPGFTTACWEPTEGSPRLSWTANGGRPMFSPEGFGNAPWVAAHVPYAYLVGGWAVDHELDHLCRNPRCIAPHHLEPVTRSENELRKRRPVTREYRPEIADMPSVVAMAERAGRAIYLPAQEASEISTAA